MVVLLQSIGTAATIAHCEPVSTQSPEGETVVVVGGGAVVVGAVVVGAVVVGAVVVVVGVVIVVVGVVARGGSVGPISRLCVKKKLLKIKK